MIIICFKYAFVLTLSFFVVDMNMNEIIIKIIRIKWKMHAKYSI